MKLDHEQARALRRHPLSAAFPDMSEEDLQSLTDDIESEGQRQPIILLNGMVLDGWHRLQACLRLLMPVEFDTLPEDIDPRRWVISQNLCRRHLTASQRAVALVECHRYEWRAPGNPNWGSFGAAEHGADSVPSPENHYSAPRAELQISDTQMAEMADVGVRTIQRAKMVISEGSDDLKAAVRDGKMSLNVAAKAVRPSRAKKDAAPEAVADTEPDDCDVGAGAELLEDMRRDLDRAESEAKEALALMDTDPAKAPLAALTRRLHHAERRQAELAEDAIRARKRADFYQRQLARCGRAVGQRDLDRVAAAVESFVQNVRRATKEPRPS